MKKNIIKFLFLITLIFISCNSENNQQSLQNDAQFVEDLEESTDALKTLAPVFSEVMLSSESLLQQVIEEAELKRDGDFNVLFSTAQDFSVEEYSIDGRHIESKTFLDCLNSKFLSSSRNLSCNTASELIEKIPYLNLYYYSPNYEKKYSADDFLITFIDYTVEEEDLTTLIAYDKAGKQYEISGIDLPEVPVIVLGISERVNMMNQGDNVNIANQTSRNVFDGKIIHDEYMYKFVYNAKYGKYDPWPRGYPEIYILYAYAPKGCKKYYNSVDKPKTYTFSDVTFSFANDPENKIWEIHVYDEDVGKKKTININLKYEIAGFSVSTDVPFTIGNGDDFLGSTTVAFYHDQNPEKGYSLGDIGSVYLKYDEYQN